MRFVLFVLLSMASTAFADWVKSSPSAPKGASAFVIAWSGKEVFYVDDKIAGAVDPAANAWRSIPSLSLGDSPERAFWTNNRLVVFSKKGAVAIFDDKERKWTIRGESTQPQSRDERFLRSLVQSFDGVIAWTTTGLYELDVHKNKWSRISPQIKWISEEVSALKMKDRIVYWDRTGGFVFDLKKQEWKKLSRKGLPPTDAIQANLPIVAVSEKLFLWGVGNRGFLYDFSDEKWTEISSSGAPVARAKPILVEGDDEVYVLGGPAGVYSVSTNSWKEISPAKILGPGLWAKDRLFVWLGLGPVIYEKTP